jgi:phosphoglycolate phosphatase-like HAD superfamily hydrolase
MQGIKKLTAVIWDYDGTLADTRLKNYQVARAVQEAVTGRSADEFAAFASIEHFEAVDQRSTNWRDLCLNYLELTAEQTEEVGRLWSLFQLNDSTPTPLYAGIEAIITGLNGVPQGIVSQNGRGQIIKILEQYGLGPYFPSVIGYEEVDAHRQKPAPDGLLNCLQELTQFQPGVAFYIGDYETDMNMVRQTNEALREQRAPIEVIAVGAFYGRMPNHAEWAHQPDHVASHPDQILALVRPYLE